MARAGSTLRLFVGAYPPPEVARRMLDLLRDVDLPRHRVTPPEQLHVTLQFIGDRAERELDGVIESVARAAAGLGPQVLTPRMLMTLPERGWARLAALETDAPPGLEELQRRLAQRLAEPGRGKGRFTPHLTLCRFAHETRMERLQAPVTMDAFAVPEIRLMRSVLKPGGAEHVPVHVQPLRAGEGDRRTTTTD